MATHASGRRAPLRKAAGSEDLRQRRERLTVSIRKQRREQRINQRRTVASPAVSAQSGAAGQHVPQLPEGAGGQMVTVAAAPMVDTAMNAVNDVDVVAEAAIHRAVATLQGAERPLYQRALEDLIANSSNRPTFMKAVFEAVDLLPRIVALTGPEFDGETTVQEHALRVLLILSLGNSRECFSVASTHGVLALLRIVDRSVAQLKAASRDGAKSATCPNSLHLACTILGNLAAASVTVQQEMVEKGTIGAVGRVADALEPSVAQRVVPWVAQHLATRELGEEDANYLARVLATLAVSANDECEELASALAMLAFNHPDSVAFSGVLGRIAFLPSTLGLKGSELPLEALQSVSFQSPVRAQAVALVALPHLHMYATSGSERTRTLAVEILGNIASGPPEQKQLLLNPALWGAITKPLGGRCTYAILRSTSSAVLSALCQHCSLAQAKWMVTEPHESVLNTAARALSLVPAPADRLTMLDGLRTLLPLVGMLAVEWGTTVSHLCDEAGLMGMLESLTLSEHAELATEAEIIYTHNFGGEMDMVVDEEDEEEEDNEEEEEEEEKQMLERHIGPGASQVPAHQLVASFTDEGRQGQAAWQAANAFAASNGPAAASAPIFTGFS